MQEHEETNPYLAEAKLQGYTPEQMLRAATMAEKIKDHLGDIELAEKAVSDILCWMAMQPESESCFDRNDIKTLGAILHGLKWYNEVNCSHSEQLLKETVAN